MRVPLQIYSTSRGARILVVLVVFASPACESHTPLGWLPEVHTERI